MSKHKNAKQSSNKSNHKRTKMKRSPILIRTLMFKPSNNSYSGNSRGTPWIIISKWFNLNYRPKVLCWCHWKWNWLRHKNSHQKLNPKKVEVTILMAKRSHHQINRRQNQNLYLWKIHYRSLRNKCSVSRGIKNHLRKSKKLTM